MELTLDIFIGSVIGIITAYSFIIGPNGVMRIIFSTYLALLAADGFALLMTKQILTLSPFLNKIAEMLGSQAALSMKMFVFIAIIVLCTVKGAFRIDFPNETSLVLRLISTAFLGILSANLIISTVLVYISGGSFLENNLASDVSLVNLYDGSILARTLIENFHISFFLPVAVFMILSFIYRED